MVMARSPAFKPRGPGDPRSADNVTLMSATGSDPAAPLHPGVAVSVTVAGVAAMLLGAALASDHGLRAALGVGSTLLAVPAMVALLALRSGWWRLALGLGALPPRTLALSALLGAALWVGSIGLLETQSLLLPPTPEYLATFREIHRALAPKDALDALVSVAVIALIPALAEELVVRGVLLPSLVRPIGPLQAVGASALLFALMHFDSYRFLFTLAIGFVFGALRLRTRSLWPPIFAHAALNSLTFVVAPLVDDPAQTTYTPQPALGLACLTAGAALAVPLLRALRPPVDSGRAGP